MLWDLFVTFLMIGAVSFGGGYSMIPVIEQEAVYNHAWMTHDAFADSVAVAGMSPGPVATNTAIFIGYKTAGLPGAIVSALGTILPSFLLIIAAAALFYKFQKSGLMQRAFYGLRPVIAGLIIYAAVSFAQVNRLIPAGVSAVTAETLLMAVIFGASLYGLIRYQLHPLVVILLSAVSGIVFFGA